MAEGFSEIARVLRPAGWASVMFHNSSDEVWSALQRAVESASFDLAAAVGFDKSQAPFKGLKGKLAGERVPGFDLVLHLQRWRRRRAAATASGGAGARIRQRLRRHVAQAPANRRTTPYLHSLVMRMLLEEGLPLAGYSYRAVEVLCAEMFDLRHGHWSVRDAARTRM